MSNEQIEEMAKLLKEGCFLNCVPCDKCTPYLYAETLCGNGYRKQSEGEWITVGTGITERVVCSNCK